MHHMTLKKYLRFLNATGGLKVIEGSEVYDELLKRGYPKEYAYAIDADGRKQVWRFTPLPEQKGTL